MSTAPSNATLLSLVVPCFNEQESLPLFMDEIDKISLELLNEPNGPQRIELVFVDDGSRDKTLETLKSIASRSDSQCSVKWISFSRNFGKEAALFAGLKSAEGDWVATMDADLQDPPSLLPAMWREAHEGDWDCVSTRRSNREGEPAIRSFFSKAFYRIINKLSDADIVDGARDYRLMNRKMVDAVLALQERNRFTKGIYGWVGFKTKWISYSNIERAAGTTKWNMWGLLKYAVDGIVSFSTAPLALASILGTVSCLIAVAFAVLIVVRAVLFGDPVAGWPSMMAAILLMGGIQLLCLGILGRYLANTYIEDKRRPLYIVRDSGKSE